MSNGQSSGFISLQQAIDMTSRYRQNKNLVIAPAFLGSDILCVCDTFDKASVQALLDKPGCTGIRLYYGMNEGLELRPILVAVNENNADILPQNTGGDGPVGTDIVDDAIRCPPYCPPPSVLNS